MDQYYAFLNYGFVPDHPRQVLNTVKGMSPFDVVNTIVTMPEFEFKKPPHGPKKEVVIAPPFRQQSFNLTYNAFSRTFMDLIMFARFIVFDEVDDTAVIKSIEYQYVQYRQMCLKKGIKVDENLMRC